MFFKLYNTNCEEMGTIIDKMACKSSSGVDEISSKVVKYLAQCILDPSHCVTVLVKHIPNNLKVALVTPVYKASEQNIFFFILKTYFYTSMFF